MRLTFQLVNFEYVYLSKYNGNILNCRNGNNPHLISWRPEKSDSVSCSIVSDLLWPLGHTDSSVEDPLSREFSRQEYWSGLPFPSPGDFPYLGIKPGSPAFAGRFFTVWATMELEDLNRTKKTGLLVQARFPSRLPANILYYHVTWVSSCWPLDLKYTMGFPGSPSCKPTLQIWTCQFLWPYEPIP